MEVATEGPEGPSGPDKANMEMETALSLPDTENLITNLKSGKLQIINVVETLGPFLTSSDVDVRIQGVKVFNDILASLPVDFLIETQLNFIASFYADRLNDNHKVVPVVLDGILSILKMKSLNKDVSRVILKSLFDNVPCQQQIRTDRHKIYTIFDLFITNRIQDVRSMGTDFILGLVFSMDGERDPRNLSFLFSILPPFLKSVNLGLVAEEMFEVLACYFPVDFNTPQDDPNAITRENLAENLSICLSASPAFAEYCVPLLLEKLDSNLNVAKMDSLQLLSRCCSTYQVSSFDLHLGSLWQALFKEISQENDADLKNQALNSLSELIIHFSKEKSVNSTCERFLKEILVPVKIHLLESKTKSKYELFAKLLLTVANASDIACVTVMQNINFPLMNQFSLLSDDGIRTVIVDYFMNIFEICKKHNISHENTDYFKFSFEMIEASTKSKCTDLKLSGFTCLSKMAELLSSEESMTFLDVLKFNIDREKIQIIANACQMALINLVKLHSECYKNYIDELCELNLIMDNSFILSRRLNTLCSLICVNDYTHIVVDKLMNLMFDGDVKITTLILEILSNVIRNKNLFDNEKLHDIQAQYNIINSILQLVNRIFEDVEEEKLKFAFNVIVVFMKSQNCAEQSKLLSDLIPKYLELLSQKNNIAVVSLEALLNSSRREADVSCMGNIISGALNFALNQNNSYIQEKSCVLIAIILNKYITNHDVIKSYEEVKVILSDRLKDNCENETDYSNSVMLISWLTKSLLLGGHSDALYWLNMMIEMLKNKNHGIQVAKHFKLIMMDSDVLNSDCFCKYNFLYRQKVFQIFLHSISQIQISENEPQFLALAYIIQYVPRTVLLMELPKIAPVLLDCLSFNEPDLLCAILDTLVFLIQNNKLSTGLQTLLSKCLKLCDKTNPIKIRVASLHCLFEIANFYPTNQLLHHKQDVLLELANRLDDPKRLVRGMAVKARTRWFLVGSPGENKDK